MKNIVYCPFRSSFPVVFSLVVLLWAQRESAAAAGPETHEWRLPGETPVAIRNGSFDEGMTGDVPTGWQAYKGGSDKRIRRLVRGPAGTSLALIDNDPGEEIGIRQALPARPDTFYRLTAVVRQLDKRSVAPGVFLQLRFLPSNRLSQVTISTVTPTPQRVSTWLTAPPDTTRAVLYLYTSRGGTPAILVDDVRLSAARVRTFAQVTAPSKRVTRTVLVQDGKSACRIVVPAGSAWRLLGEKLRDAIAAKSGARPEIVAAGSLSDKELAAQTAILIGNICNNRSLLYAYSHSLTFADGLYPGPGGYDVRTIHDPWGAGHNLVVVGASDAAGAAKGLAVLEQALPAGKTMILAPFLKTELTGEARKRWGGVFSRKLDDKWLAQQKKNAERQLARGIHGGIFSLAKGMGQNYALSRRTPYAEMFVWLIRRAQSHHDSKPKTYGGPWGMDSDFLIYSVIPGWDAVEECPALDDAARLEVTRILFRWVSDLAYKGRVHGNGVRFNHTTFPALGCLYAGQYFQNHYGVLQGTLWIRQADEVFRFQAKTTKPRCDCNSYQWLPIHHTMLYSLARGDLTYFENGRARECAEYVVLNMNGLGYQAPYGDVGNWRCWGPSTTVLRIVYWYSRDAKTAWALARKTKVDARAFLGQYYTRIDSVPAPPLPPALEAWPVTAPWYGTFAGKADPPRERTVDKIVFRDGFAPRDSYLLLDGLARGAHGHMDANAILQWTANDRIWLADTDYIKSLPKFHNTLLILKDGQSARIPGFCELRNAVDLPSFAVSRTVLRDYTDTDWERTVVWRKGAYFVVIDRMTARKDGEYSFRAVWQTLGVVTLEGSTLDIDQDGEHARFALLPGTRCLLHDDLEQGRNWAGYPYAPRVVRVLEGIVSGPLRAGESRTLATVLHASGKMASEARIERLGKNLFRVTGAGDPLLLALPDARGRIVIPEMASARADLLLVTPRRAAAVDLRELTEPVLEAELPESADFEVELGSGRATCYTPARTRAVQKSAFSRFEIDPLAQPDEVERAIGQLPAEAPPAATAVGETAVPELPVAWTFADVPHAFLVTGNGGAFGSVDAGLHLTASPKPLAANVFSGVTGGNRIENITDGVLQGTDGAVMWDDNQEVTLDLTFERVLRLRELQLDAWFAATSSKGKKYQLGRIRILASCDGFHKDRRVLADRAETASHPSWGTPVPYRFAGLEAEARQVRLVLTPRPGSAVYIAELKIRANADWLTERYRRVSGGGNSFHCMQVADLDGDGPAEILLGAASGELICLEGRGRQRWRARAGSRPRAVSSIALGGGKRLALIGGGDAVVRAFTAAGKPAWEFAMPAYKCKGIVRVIFAADLDGTGRETAVIGGENWRYYAVDAQGRERWHYESVHASTVGLATDLDGDRRDECVLGTYYYWWTCVDPAGNKRWSYRTAGGPGARALAAGNVQGDDRPEVIFGGEDTLVQAVSPDGKRLWTFSTGDEVSALHCLDVDHDGRDEILAASLSFNVYCLDGAGRLRWRRDLGAPVLAAAPARFHGAGVLAAGCGDGSVVLLRLTDGMPLARAVLGGAVTSLAADKKRLLVAAVGKLFCLSLEP